MVGLATVAEEALVTVHRFRPELALVDAPIDLDGSPTVVARISKLEMATLPCGARWSHRPAARSS